MPMHSENGSGLLIFFMQTILLRKMELYVALMYRSVYDYEIILASEVPALMLENPGRSGYIQSIPGELFRLSCVCGKSVIILIF